MMKLLLKAIQSPCWFWLGFVLVSVCSSEEYYNSSNIYLDSREKTGLDNSTEIEEPIIVNPSAVSLSSPPRIIADVDDDGVSVKAIGSDWIVQCVGDHPVTWACNNGDENSREVTPDRLLAGGFSSVLKVSNVSHLDVQTCKCHYVADADDDGADWSSASCMLGNMSCAHLFVDDEINLLANVESIKNVVSFIGQPLPLVIPCIPTSPHVQVNLVKSPGTVIPKSAFTATEGYTINSVTFNDAGSYDCEGTRGNATQVMRILVHVYDFINENPMINSSRARAVKSGESFTLNCTLETAAIAPFHLMWSAPASVIEDTSRATLQDDKAIMSDTHSSSAKTLTWTSLTVTNATKDDEAIYLCTLRQKLGMKHANFSLHIDELNEPTYYLEADSRENEISGEFSDSEPEQRIITARGHKENVVIEDVIIERFHCTTTTAATTTLPTTQRILTPKEMEAVSTLMKTNATVESTMLHLYKVRTQVVLKSLEKILPQLEAIQNSSRALLKTPVQLQLFSTYKNQEDELENEMNTIEDNLKNNSLQISKYSTATKDAERQFRHVQQTLASVLASQFPNTTDIRKVLGIVDRSPREIREFLQGALHNSEGQPTEITEFITNLQLPENRNGSYFYVMRELRKNYSLLPIETTEKLMFHMVKDVYQFPEFQEFKHALPVTVLRLLSSDLQPVAIKPKAGQGWLTINSSNNSLQVETSRSSISNPDLQKVWKFIPLEDGTYYLIAHAPSNQVLGILDDQIHLKKLHENVKELETGHNLDAVFLSDLSYKWEVTISPGDPMSLKFCSSFSELTLAWRTTSVNSGPALVFPEIAVDGDGTVIQWELQ